MNLNPPTSSWTPTKLWEPLQIWTVVLAIVKITTWTVAFDWSSPWHCMVGFGSCASIILYSFLLCIPFGVFRRKQIQVLTFLCADIALACTVFINVGSAAGFIAGSLMLATTVALKLIYNQRQRLLCVPAKGKLQYCCYLLLWGALAYFARSHS